MTSNVVKTRLQRSNTSGLRNEAGRPTAAVNQLSRAKKLAESLLSERGEASGAVVVRELHEVLRILVAEDRGGTSARPREPGLRLDAHVHEA